MNVATSAAPDPLAWLLARSPVMLVDEFRRQLTVRGCVVEIEFKPLEVLIQLLHHAGGKIPRHCEPLRRSVRSCFRIASSLMDNIDSKPVAQLTGIPDWSANLDLARADIAVRRADFSAARKTIQPAIPVFSRC